MVEIREPEPVKLFIGLLIAKVTLLPQLYNLLEEKLGPIDLRSEFMDFTFTKYYEKEMGAELKRQFLGFSNLIAPDKLAEIKLFTNELEKDLAQEKKRQLNLDPGYLAAAKIVLATTKDYAHRIYLKYGIYAEVTLLFQRGQFNPLPWSYPDYRSEAYLKFFNELRRQYLVQLKAYCRS